MRTTVGDDLLSGVKRTGILALLITVRKLHPSDDSTKKQFSSFIIPRLQIRSFLPAYFVKIRCILKAYRR